VLSIFQKAVEIACWVALPFSRKAVLAGDHLQLPPTIMSPEAAKRGLEKTLMERVIAHWGQEVVRMLTTQYRMNFKIMQWSSEALYEGRLLADASVAEHLLKDLDGVEEDDNTGRK
jgi:superfamily I DNA and/or RNA helicase